MSQETQKCYTKLPHPADNIFTLSTLMPFDGKQARMYIGLAGSIFDVSPSENFVPEMGYGKLWGGKDATYSLCKMLLDPELANTTNFVVADLNDLEKKALKGWIDHFKKKYEQVGTLEEMADFDVSELDNMSDPSATADEENDKTPRENAST